MSERILTGIDDNAEFAVERRYPELFPPQLLDFCTLLRQEIQIFGGGDEVPVVPARYFADPFRGAREAVSIFDEYGRSAMHQGPLTMSALRVQRLPRSLSKMTHFFDALGFAKSKNGLHLIDSPDAQVSVTYPFDRLDIFESANPYLQTAVMGVVARRSRERMFTQAPGVYAVWGDVGVLNTLRRAFSLSEITPPRIYELYGIPVDSNFRGGQRAFHTHLPDFIVAGWQYMRNRAVRTILNR